MDVICPQCSTRFRTAPEMVGKRVTCPKCDASVVVPATVGQGGEEFEIAGTLSTGASITFTLRAADATAAAEAAKAQGMTVRSVMPKAVRGHTERRERTAIAEPLGDDPAGPAGDPSREGEIIWSATPSQWTNFWAFVLCLLVIPIPWAFWRYLVIRCTRYELTSQRLRLVQGVFSKSVDEIELYRVRDTSVHQSFIERLVGIGTVTMLSADVSDPELVIRSIRKPREVREHIRTCVERRKLTTRSRTLEMTDQDTLDH